MTDLSDQPLVVMTNYEREQASFARMHAELRQRKRAGWLRRVTRFLGIG